MRNSSSRCSESSGRPESVAGGDREHDRQRADEQRPLVHLRRHQRAEPGAGVEPPREQPGDEQLGRFGGERCDPLHEQERADARTARRSGRATRRTARRTGGSRRPRTRAASPTTTRRCVGRQRADQLGGTDEVRLLRRRAADPQHVRDEEADEDDRVDEASACSSAAASASRASPKARNAISIACGRSRPDVGVERALVALACGRCASSATPRAGPPATSPTPISSRFPPVMLASASGAYFSGFSPALQREREVDGVLGQDRDEGQHGEREALRDVELERLGGPGEDERGPEDGQAEHDRGHHVAEVAAREPGDGAREGQRQAANRASACPRLPRQALGVPSGPVGVTRPILRAAFRPKLGLTSNPRMRKRRMNSQERGKNSRSQGCWMRGSTGLSLGWSTRKQEADDQPLAPVRTLPGSRPRALLPTGGVRRRLRGGEGDLRGVPGPRTVPGARHHRPGEAGRLGRPRRARTTPARPSAPPYRVATTTLRALVRALPVPPPVASGG